MPPGYLMGCTVAPEPHGPARYLRDGQWCGHSELLFAVFDVRATVPGPLTVYLPSDRRYPSLSAVAVAPSSGERFLVYDPRQHPASVYADQSKEFPYVPGPAHRCEVCGSEGFAVSLGLEIPGDATEPEDTSWFALAVECQRCGMGGIIFDDETA
jgi:hypothetical protein